MELVNLRVEASLRQLGKDCARNPLVEHAVKKGEFPET
jgi:hypothetical protein